MFELPQRLPRPSARVDARPRLRNQSLLSTVDGYGTPGARRVFGAQTAGYPYHRLVVALATLVENRLPGLALASGGLDPSDGEEACALLEHVLGETFAPPIVVDEPRLRAELAACFEEPALTERLTALLREPSHPIFGDLLGVLMKGSAGIRRDLERRVAGLRNLDEIGEMTREFLCRMAVSLAKAFRRHELQDATIVRCGSTIATSSCESSRVRVSC